MSKIMMDHTLITQGEKNNFEYIINNLIKANIIYVHPYHKPKTPGRLLGFVTQV